LYKFFRSIIWSHIFLLNIYPLAFLLKIKIDMWNYSETNFFTFFSNLTAFSFLSQIFYSSAIHFIYIIIIILYLFYHFLSLFYYFITFLFFPLFSFFFLCFFFILIFLILVFTTSYILLEFLLSSSYYKINYLLICDIWIFGILSEV